MKRTLNILFILFFAFGVSSCAKEELENPSQAPAPHAIMKADLDTEINNTPSEINDNQLSPVYINDDGDEEDEGLKPTIPTEVKK